MKFVHLIDEFHPSAIICVMTYPRNISQDLIAALKDTPVVLVNGARQTGKSTLVKAISSQEGQKRPYLTFDDPTILAQAENPGEFVNNLPEYVVLDEVQRAPQIFLPLKKSIDENRKPGRIILTGSAHVLTLPKLADTLVGRMEILTLWPLSQAEIRLRKEGFVDSIFEGQANRDVEPVQWSTLVELMAAGGFPDALAKSPGKRRDNWFRSYMKTLVERDMQELSRIEGLTSVPKLLQLLAFRAGNLLNIADVSSACALPQTTIKRYISLLEALFVMLRIPPWFGNPEKRLVKTPKVFLIDTGLLMFLRDLSISRLLTDKSAAGPVLENFVIQELIKQLSWSETRAGIYHFRTHSGREVDFVLESSDGRIVGIEVKAASSVQQEDFAGLRYLKELAGNRFHCGIVLYTGEHTLLFERDLMLMPISAIWQVASELTFNIFKKP